MLNHMVLNCDYLYLYMRMIIYDCICYRVYFTNLTSYIYINYNLKCFKVIMYLFKLLNDYYKCYNYIIKHIALMTNIISSLIT